jgi:hypothetical protein
MKIDPYNHKGTWIRWKDKVRKLGGIPDISRQNSDIILRYLNDMELGINISLGSHKGARISTSSLLTLYPCITSHFPFGPTDLLYSLFAFSKTFSNSLLYENSL